MLCINLFTVFFFFFFFKGAVEIFKYMICDQMSLSGCNQSSFLITKYYFLPPALFFLHFSCCQRHFTLHTTKGEHSFSLKSSTGKSRGLSIASLSCLLVSFCPPPLVFNVNEVYPSFPSTSVFFSC